MSDNMDKDTAEPSVEFDFDSTVELDLDKLGLVSSPPTDKPPLDADFDETLNGLMEIDELLNEEVAPISEPATQKQEPSSDSLDFDEVDTGIEELLEPAGEADEYMPEMAEKREESDDIFDLDISDLPDEDAGDENELLAGNFAQPAEVQSLPDSPNDEEPQAVVELTEEMLDEPEETDDQAIKDLADDFLSTRENDLLSEVVNEFAEKNARAGKPTTDDAGMPELTTTETNIVSDATAAIEDIDEYVDEYDEEDDGLPEIDVTATIPPKPETGSEEALSRYVKQSSPIAGRRRSNAIPLLFATLGIAAGGFGAWVAFDATEKADALERRIQSMARTGNYPQSHDITDIQQRLAKVERRLSGMPTLEAAAPLGVEPAMVSPEPVKEPTVQPAAPLEAGSSVVNSRPEPLKEAVVQPPAPITPQTPIAPTSSIGDWVVNVSSHANRELATKENGRLKAQGLNPEVHTAEIRGRTWYRVQVTGFTSKDEAKASLKDLQQRLGIQGAWIGKR
ncbi:SPOR domain-containing protein [Pseudomonadota bacterium]